MTASGRGPSIAVLDYGIGNLRSAQKALAVVGADAKLTANPADIRAADGVVLPGVGAFGACMNALRAAGLDEMVHESVAGNVPFLGICVGMQMLFDGSDESPDVSGLGVFPGRVRWLPEDVKRPQMQWNRISAPSIVDQDLSAMSRALLSGLDGQWVYFVHSLAAEPTTATVATVEYGETVTAAVGRAAVFATQFHPEKSASAGLELLGRFVRFCADGSANHRGDEAASGTHHARSAANPT